MFKRVLIANRGEIAVRAMRTCREMGISPIAVYSDVDATALHVRMADYAVPIGPAPARESYLVFEKILDAARRSGAEAIYPGYGFLSENAEFAEACAATGLVFIGPPPRAIREMGEKTLARKRMQAAGVPVVPGDHGGEGGFPDAEAVLVAARRIGFPVMLKAAAGGGGKGMRLVQDEGELRSAFDAARREALSAFGNGAVYLEKYIANPRHVEVQIMVDAAGHGLQYFERDCSIQRRHQKVIEETPCPVLDDALRQEMGAVALRAALAVDYRGAGTIEFLFDSQARRFYFLEMNTRLQVEHPITELCCGVDLVRQQLLVADGQQLPLTQGDIRPRGAAIECRICAEDPEQFLPSPGPVRALRVPSGPGIRDDSGVYAGAEISTHYDPLLSKLCVWAAQRDEAIARMRRALDEYRVAGIQTNLPLHRLILKHPVFISGRYDTGFIGAHASELRVERRDPDIPAVAAAIVHSERRTRAAASSRTQQPSQQQSAWRRAVR